jgi:hypothetical protein
VNPNVKKVDPENFIEEIDWEDMDDAAEEAATESIKEAKRVLKTGKKKTVIKKKSTPEPAPKKKTVVRRKK